MIFTGVTGGEIVSLLYPLFILNAFCYIIISKESLDGCSNFILGIYVALKKPVNTPFLADFFPYIYIYFW